MEIAAALDPGQSEMVLDSLPYVEAVHEDYEEYALALIEEEMKEFQPRSMKKMPAIKFRTPIMETEYITRMVDNEFVPRPERSYQPLKIARPTNLDEWKTIAIPQAKSRLEAERIRTSVLEAEKEEGVLNWKAYNTQSLEQLKNHYSTALQKQREAVEEINYQRQQTQQQQLGPQLDQLNLEYQQALYRRNQLEHAIEGLRRSKEGTGAEPPSSESAS
jgi:hypothetical protein